MEIEFPTAGLGSVPGDGEGGIEMTESMQLIREFCDRFISSEKATRTRIFFPEASEVDFARQSVFSGCSFKLDYLTNPSFFEDFGFVEKIKMSDRVKTGDEHFLVSYPYFNANEILVVEELYKEEVLNTERKLIIFNGELDRIRSGYYPSFFYPKLAALTNARGRTPPFPSCDVAIKRVPRYLPYKWVSSTCMMSKKLYETGNIEMNFAYIKPLNRH
ncbi:uncharacterized protein LOC114419914 [Glycine soja]|uniref:uncharacterized protein LOC114419914 n=1 Tax=Glycine soja TaxID=3848 RepID=UPI0010395DBE|nr:uncharacterized protein LOC114419914 [Glycine soja]